MRKELGNGTNNYNYRGEYVEFVRLNQFVFFLIFEALNKRGIKPPGMRDIGLFNANKNYFVVIRIFWGRISFTTLL